MWDTAWPNTHYQWPGSEGIERPTGLGPVPYTTQDADAAARRRARSRAIRAVPRVARGRYMDHLLCDSGEDALGDSAVDALGQESGREVS